MENIFKLIPSGLIMGYFANFVWNRIMHNKIDFKNWRIHAYSIITSLFQFTIHYFVNHYIKVALLTIVFVILIKLFYKEKIKNAIIVAIVFQTIVFISEFIFAIGLTLIFKNNTELITGTTGTLLTNIIIAIVAIGLSYLFNVHKIYKNLINMTNKIKFSNLIVFVLILIVSINIFLALPYYEIKTSTVVIINAVMVIIYSIIMFKFIEQKNRYIDINDKYSLTESSLKELQNNVNRLMTINHENKNQLLTIRTMVANKDKTVLKSIDAIIEQKVKDDKDLKVKTSVISNTMLGALVYSKMLTMKEKKIITNLHIDKSLSKVDFINLGDKTNIDICKIIGVYLDNAIDATQAAKEKEIFIHLYLEDESIVILIGNSFAGDVDVNRIGNYGYTTKSEGHGYGLALVKELLKENDKIMSETEINDNVFVQKLKIKM